MKVQSVSIWGMVAMGVAVWLCQVGSAAASEPWQDNDQSAAVQAEDPPPGPGPQMQSAEPRRPGDEPGWRERRGDRIRRWREREIGEDRPRAPTQEMIVLAMEVLREKLPEEYQRMESLKSENPQRFERAIGMMLPVVMEYVELRDQDQKLADTIIEEFKVERQLRSLSQEYKAAAGDAAKQAACEEKIRTLVRQEFDLRAVRQEARLKEFAERLEKQRAHLEEERAEFAQRKAKVDEFVARRVEDVKSGKLRERFRAHQPKPGGPGREGEAGKASEGPGHGCPPPPGRPDQGHPRGPRHGGEPGMGWRHDPPPPEDEPRE